MNTFGRAFQNRINRIFINEQDIITNEENMNFWKNNIFSIVSISIIFLGMPAFFYGAILFFINGSLILSGFEFAAYFSICIVLTQKRLSIEFRKLFLISIVYSLSILLLIYTGPQGAGMVCVLFSLILSAVLLNTFTIFIFVVLNLLVFILLSILLITQGFSDYAISLYKNMWYINGITTEICGISLLILIRSIYGGLENQNDKIEESKMFLLNSELRHKTMIANISDVILILDSNGLSKYISPNIVRKFSTWNTLLLMHPLWDLVAKEETTIVKNHLLKIMENPGSEICFQSHLFDNDGNIKYIEFNAANLMEDSNINGILINFHDVTERKLREDRISYLFERDSLTGLYNRHLMDQKIAHLDIQENLPLSVIYGDLNGLKIMNDAFGHTEGDKLLVAIANILQKASNYYNASVSHDLFLLENLVFRIGGDEFLMIFPKTDQTEATKIVNAIYQECELYNKEIYDDSFFLSISLGSYTKYSMEDTIDNAIKEAEECMYKRKLLDEKSIHSSIILSMLKVLAEKSLETEEHAVRLVYLSKKVGMEMGLSENQLNDLELLAKLHDIGKIGVDKAVLEKKEPLTNEDWEELKKHPDIGYRIAKSSPEIASIAELIYTHHERFDGSGYPMKLKGVKIPLLSRIISVVDAYDAMTEDRVYRKRMSSQDALHEIIKNSGTQFDPSVVTIFQKIIAQEEPSDII